MNIGKENYDEILELLGNLVENMEDESVERSYGSGCGLEYEHISVYAIEQSEFDYDKMEELFKRLKNIRPDKIEKILSN